MVWSRSFLLLELPPRWARRPPRWRPVRRQRRVQWRAPPVWLRPEPPSEKPLRKHLFAFLFLPDGSIDCQRAACLAQSYTPSHRFFPTRCGGAFQTNQQADNLTVSVFEPESGAIRIKEKGGSDEKDAFGRNRIGVRGRRGCCHRICRRRT